MATSNSVRASSFTASAETRDLVYNTLLHNSMYLVQAIGLPLAFYLKPFCIICALFWLSYRASQVLNKDLTDLAQLLGFELPLKPVLDLTGIRADGAIVHWTLPEKQRHKSTLKYEVYVNGNVIDTVSLHESAVTITGLQPGSFYVVRVALVNSLEFSSKSAPIRFLTKPAASGDFYQVTADGHETDHDASRESLPTAKPYRGLKDVVPASPDMIAPPMLRENSTGLGHKKSITGRRPSPAVLGLDSKHDPAAEDCEPPEGAESIQQLTAKLDSIRHETEEAEKQMREEEEEESRQKEELIKERDELRLEVGKKEKANRDLKKEVNILERQNTAAQNERSKHERILQQKKQERQKMKEDNERWIRETEEFKAETERIKQKKTELLAQHEKEKEVQRQKLAAVTADLKFLDEDTREKTVEIKKIERAAKNSSPNGVEPETNLVQQMQQDHEEDRAFQMRRFELQQQYAAAVQRLEGAKAFHAEQVRFLEGIRAGRRRAEEAAAASAAREFPSPPATSERGLRRGDSERSRRGTSNESPRMSAFPPVSSSSPFGGNMAATAFSSAPFLNIHNGMTIAAPTAGLDISEEEKDKLTGGAPMSPGAGAELLPADLFSGDDSRDRENIGPLPGLGTLPGLAGAIPGLGAQPSQQVDFTVPGPASPGSTSSRSPSTFASPRASQNNLHAGSPENYMDSDRRSIQSTRSNRAPSGSATGSRFSSMFGIKPRVKNSSTDDSLAGPALAKAQSVPRQDQGVSGLDSATRKRNSSISGSVFGGVLSRGVQSDETEDLMDGSTAESPMQARRRPFNLFHRDKGPDGWPSSFTLGGRRPASPRPGSTHSSELPRPSFDSSRWGVDTWPSNDAASGARNSPLSFGSWNVPIGSQQPRAFGSRHPSRRPSVQHGASGPPEDIMEDEDDTDALDSDAEPNLPPIGTRPAGSKRVDKQAEAGAAQSDADADAAQPKLNPNAKDFKSFFSLSNMRLSSSKDKSKDGGEASSSSKTQTSATPAGGNTPLLNNHHSADDEVSPPASRKSKDTRSMTTIESSASTDNLARTPSYSNASDTNSNASPLIGAGSFSGKESFMQKISRKSSSGKFSLPTFKREKSKLPEPATPTAEDVGGDEETAIMGGSTSSLKEKGGRTWSTVLKLGKGRERKVGDAPSVSGASAADEEEGDEEELLEK